jgi:hypothetical protein
MGRPTVELQQATGDDGPSTTGPPACCLVGDDGPDTCSDDCTSFKGCGGKEDCSSSTVVSELMLSSTPLGVDVMAVRKVGTSSSMARSTVELQQAITGDDGPSPPACCLDGDGSGDEDFLFFKGGGEEDRSS